MALSCTRFSWLWLGGKAKDQVSNGSSTNSINSLDESGLGLREEPESLKLYSMNSNYKRIPPSNSNRKKAKRKWKRRGDSDNRIDREHDVVLVPSDGFCLSESESDDSDWSIGWLEPHDPGFQCDGDVDNSFAVLVPCYRHDCQELEGNEFDSGMQFLGAVKNRPNGYSDVGREYMERWLSSLEKF
ncbi:demethylmenaquinone methyltransferase [Striga asiatica]|uniref:Demethylmenaquinone methyltransferase n=1 Tax=Striga asiatica TaxID=4170 RepID=A0A5A7QPJ9_STRAF|nr:demethylmenaquinone methyltransferase [Striga asiatica]